MAQQAKKKLSQEKNKQKKSPARKVARQPRTNFFRRYGFHLALFTVTFIVFGNSIFNGYALDDEFFTNHRFKSQQKTIKDIPKIFSSTTFFNNDGTGYDYRPVTVATFAIETQFFGENPYVSHFISVLIYAFSILLVFGILRKWFHTQGDWFSFFVCLLFMVLSVHCEVVTNIKCRDELLAFFFSFLSLHFYFNGYVVRDKIIALLPAFIFFLAAVLSKETIYPFIALFPFAAWYFGKAGWKKIFIGVFVLGLGVAVKHLIIQACGVPHMERTFKTFENPFYTQHTGIMTHMATVFYILGRYLWLHFIPYPLVYYYGYKYVDIVHWSSPLAILSLLAYAALCFFAFRGSAKKTVVGFGLMFYLVNLAAFSNFVTPAPGMMAERYTYASSLGFCIVLVWLIFYLYKKDPAQFRWKSTAFKSVRLTLLVVCGLYAARTFFRNEDWKSKDVLYAHDMQFLGNSAKANMLLAELYSERAMQAGLRSDSCRQNRNFDQARKDSAEKVRIFLEARQHYLAATKIAPYYHTAWNNLGTTYFYLNDAKGGLPFFLRSVKEDSGYDEGLLDAGKGYALSGNMDSAEYFFRRALHFDSTSLRGYEELSMLYFQSKNDTAGALKLLQTSARNNPKSDQPWAAMGQIYLHIHDTAAAARVFEMAAKINPSDFQRMVILANYFGRHGDLQKKKYYEAQLDRASDNDPDNGPLQAMLVNYYGGQGNGLRANYYLGLLETNYTNHPDDARLLVYLCNFYRAQNNMQKFNYYYGLLQQKQPNP